MYFLFALLLLPLGEDLGSSGLFQALKRLQTTARVLYIADRPGGEDASALTYLSRGMGAEVALLSLTRGEDGPNRLTAHTGEALAALRTLELLKAAQYYGCEVRFTSAIAPAAGGRKLVDDVVAVIRQFRPHVLLSSREASGIAGEAFEAVAGDMVKPSKLYVRVDKETEPWTVRLETGDYDPVLGRSYAQFGREGKLWHRSQDTSLPPVGPGSAPAFYLMMRHRMQSQAEKEQSFFHGLEQETAPPAELAQLAIQAAQSFSMTAPEVLAPVLARGVAAARALSLHRTAALWEKALNQSLGAELEANPSVAVAVPGQEVAVALTFHLRTGTITRTIGAPIPVVRGASIEGGLVGGIAPSGAANQTRLELDPLASWEVTAQSQGLFRVIAAPDATPTKAQWSRRTPDGKFYEIEDARLIARPLPRPPLLARALYQVEGVPVAVETYVPLTLVPPVSVRVASRRAGVVQVVVRNFNPAQTTVTVRLDMANGPAAQPVRLEKTGEERTVTFRTAPGAAVKGAIATLNGVDYREEFEPVTYPGLDSVYVAR
jgi:hypothetical protein